MVKKIFIELKKGTRFSELDEHGSLPQVANEDMKVELVQKKMGITYFKMGDRICKVVLSCMLIFLPSCYESSFAETDLTTKRIEIAKSQIGKGEKGGNNAGEDVYTYTKNQSVPWCAAFVSWVRRQAGEEAHYIYSARQYWELYKDRRVDSPRAGDIMCFWRKGKDSGLGHVGIVIKVTEKYIYTIEGNKGKYPAKVKELRYARDKEIPRLLGYVRLDKEKI